MGVADKNFQSPSSLFAKMDLEETVRELKSDLKNARELISCLTENVKAMKPGRDKDLHRKLDEILSQRENQKELEKKMDGLREEIKKVADKITESEEMKHLKDSVETCVGYQELFVKDFERIQGKIQEMKGEFSVKFDNLEQKLKGDARESGNIGIGFKNIEQKIKNFEKNLEGIVENGQKLDVFGKKIEKLGQELKEKIDLISKTSEEMKKKMEMNVKPITLQSNETKEEIKEKLTEINKKEQNIPGTNFKCWLKNCNSILPKDLPLREDGVSVNCPKCNYLNIVGKLKEGHKWMRMVCLTRMRNEFHFQQFAVDKKHGDKRKCQVCGKDGELWDANFTMAVPC